MVLNLNPIPSFNACRTVVFGKNKQYITRTYYRISVLIFVLDGELRFREDGKEIAISKGEYYIQRDGLFQEGLPNVEPPTFFYVEFMGTYSDSFFGIPIRGTFDEKKIIPIANKLEELFRQNSMDKLHINSNANLFILNSYMNRIFSELFVSFNLIEQKSTLSYHIHNYIQSNYFKKITLAGLAERFNYDKDYLAELFKAQYGCTPLQYQTQLRMEQAAWLLETTKLSAEKIAEDVGYEAFSTFYRNFLRFRGMSPGAYRESTAKTDRKARKKKTGE